MPSPSEVVVNGCGRGGVAVLPVLPCGPRTQIQNSYNTEQSPHSSAQSQYTILHIIALVYAHIVGLNSFLISKHENWDEYVPRNNWVVEWLAFDKTDWLSIRNICHR